MNNLRTQIESIVIAHNKVLRDKVKEMNLVALLRNMHPIYRSDFAYRLLRKDLITKAEAHEFVKLV